MFVRVVVLAAVLFLAFASVHVAGRRMGRVAGLAPSGLTLVVSDGCRTCTRAVAALDGAGAVYRVVDVADAAEYGVSSLSVPYAIVGDRNGGVVAVRRGMAVVQTADELTALAAH